MDVNEAMADEAGIASMEAVQYASYHGGAHALQHCYIEIPRPGKGEILVRVLYTSLNPVDMKIQKGLLKATPGRFPYVPCSDVSGVVSEVGPGVVSFSPGDRVLCSLDMTRGGGLATYAIADSMLCVKLPDEVSCLEACGLPIAALSALQSLENAGVTFSNDDWISRNILVTAASGGVGSYAVQLAKLSGAHVVATCGARNVELVKSLGADEVLDYKSPQGQNFQSSTCKSFDVVINCALGVPLSMLQRFLSAKAKLVDVTPGFGFIGSSSSVDIIPLFMVPDVAQLQLLVDLIAKGRLKTLVDSVHSLKDAQTAWRTCIAGHATGKVIVKVPGLSRFDFI